MTLRDGMGREVGGRVRMGNTQDRRALGPPEAEINLWGGVS